MRFVIAFDVPMAATLAQLNEEIVRCRLCPRLVKYRQAVARVKRPAFREWRYWGKPVPGFGDPQRNSSDPWTRSRCARRQPHGQDVHGRSLGRFPLQSPIPRGLREPTNFYQPRRWAGSFNNAYISATLRCAPPANKPLPSELVNCKPYFERELKLIRPSAVLALGGIAMRAYLLVLKQQGAIERPSAFTFRHGASYDLGPNLPRLFVSYHPSQQNTFTGKLTEAMLANVLRDIRRFLKKKSPI